MSTMQIRRQPHYSTPNPFLSSRLCRRPRAAAKPLDRFLTQDTRARFRLCEPPMAAKQTPIWQGEIASIAPLFRNAPSRHRGRLCNSRSRRPHELLLDHPHSRCPHVFHTFSMRPTTILVRVESEARWWPIYQTVQTNNGTIRPTCCGCGGWGLKRGSHGGHRSRVPTAASRWALLAWRICFIFCGLAPAPSR